MSTTLASISDVEAVVNRDVPTADRGRVLRLIKMVSGQVVNYTGQAFAQVVDDELTLTPHDGVLRLPQRPVTAVASVTIAGSVVDPTLYTVNTNGYLRRTSPSYGPDSAFGVRTGVFPIDGEWPWPPIETTVVYTHGYTTPDDYADVSMVVAEVVAAKWIGGGNAATNLTGVQVDQYAEHYSKAPKVGAWSDEHKAILDTYRRSGLASLRLG